MKQILLGLLVFWGASQIPSYAQNKNYTDDIYYNSSDVEKENEAAREREREEARRRAEDSSYYSSAGYEADDRNYDNQARSYESDGYADYEDYSYATRINRFNYPFYNMGYYSMFYNPYWYDPFWTDPYWGWSPWARPGFSVSFGYGPYWSSYWGWHSWYGYPGFYSYYYYPYYCYPYGNYYSGYWNGYYAGLYGGGYRHVVYGPRNSGNVVYNTGRRVGVHSAGSNGPRGLRLGNVSTTPRSHVQAEPSRNSLRSERNGVYNSSGRNAETGRNSLRSEDRPVRQRFQLFGNDRNEIRERDQRETDRRQFEQRQQRYEQPRQERRETPRYEQRQQRTETPRFQPSRSESPRTSSPTPSRSSSGSGSFGGRRR